jgi:hypothetical protein
MSNCNCNILKSTASSAVSSAVLLLTPTNTLTPTNQTKVKILVSNDTPTDGLSLPVSIVMDGANVPILDKYGNLIYGYKLTKNTVLCGYYGTDGIGNAAHYSVVYTTKLSCCGCSGGVM